MRFHVLAAASMKFRFVFWDVLPCKIIVDDVSEVCAASIIRAMVEAARTSQTSVDNYFTRQYTPEEKSEVYYYLVPEDDRNRLKHTVKFCYVQ
jgi:hypothetical protein